MPRLRSADLFRFSQALAVLHAEVEPDTVFNRLSQAAMLAIDAETACFDGYDPSGRIGPLGAHPEGLFVAQDFPALGAHLPEHPLYVPLMNLRLPTALRTSDFCRMPNYFRTTLFNRFYRPVAITHQLVLGLEVEDYGWVTCALARNRRDFTEADRTVLHLLKPHFQAAVRHARTVRRLRRAASAATLADYGLTAREASILGYLGRGLTDKEIGQQSGISPRTVQNHLQNIYSKLGVNSRTAALTQVLGTGGY